jgi:hypothetical protein
VEVAVDSRNPEKGRKSLVSVTFVASIVAASCWSASAFGRTQTETDCSAVARALQSLEAPVESLSVNTVDHVAIDAGAAELDSINIETASADSGTPLLYLTPRVANALRDIFDNRQETGAPDAMTELSSSPIAETEDVAERPERPDDTIPKSDGEAEIALPLLQRQMYRTDI